MIANILSQTITVQHNVKLLMDKYYLHPIFFIYFYRVCLWINCGYLKKIGRNNNTSQIYNIIKKKYHITRKNKEV